MGLWFDRITWDYMYWGISSSWRIAHGHIGDEFDHISNYINYIIVYNYNRLVETAETILWKINYQVNPRITALEDSYTTFQNNINALWKEVYDYIPDELDALDADIDTLWKEVYRNIPAELDTLDADIDTLWDEVFSYLPAELDKLSHDLQGIIGEVEGNMTAMIESLATALETEIGLVTQFINTELNALDTDISGRLNELISFINVEFDKTHAIADIVMTMLESSLWIPLSILAAVLRDDNNIHSNYRAYWQLFINKLMGTIV